MADGDTVFGEERVRGRVIPLDAINLGSKQVARQQADREEIARSMHDVMVEHVEEWVLNNGLTIDEDTEMRQRELARRRRRRA